MSVGGTLNVLVDEHDFSSSIPTEQRFLPLLNEVDGGWLGRIDLI